MATLRLAAWTALGFTFLYAFTAPLRIENIDGQERFEVSWALLEQGRPAPGNSDYLRRVVVRGRRAPWVSYYGIGQSILALPLVTVARAASGGSRVAGEIAYAALGPIVGGATVGVFLLVLLELGHGVLAAFAATVLLGVGSCLWPAANTTMEAPVVALGLLVVAYATAWRMRRGGEGRGPLVLGAIAMGVLGLVRETDAAAGLPLLAALVLVRKEKRVEAIATIGACALPFLALYVGYNLWRYDSPLSLAARIQVVEDQQMPAFGDPLRALYGLTVGPGKGLLYYSPLAIVGLLGYPALGRRSPLLASAALATFGLTLLTILPLAAWRGDWTWGPRYLFGAAPLLHLGLPAVLATARSRSTRAALALIASAAIAVQVAAVSVFYYRYFLDRALEMDYVYDLRPAEALPEPQVVYHFRELPGVVARTWSRLEDPRGDVARGLDVASAPASPRSLAKRGPEWARRYAAFDAVPYFWIYYDLATRGALRIPLRLAALFCLGGAALALWRAGKIALTPEPEETPPP